MDSIKHTGYLHADRKSGTDNRGRTFKIGDEIQWYPDDIAIKVPRAVIVDLDETNANGEYCGVYARFEVPGFHSERAVYLEALEPYEQIDPEPTPANYGDY